MKKLIHLPSLFSTSSRKLVCFRVYKSQILHSSSLVDNPPVSSRSTRTRQPQAKDEIASFGSLFQEISVILGAESCDANVVSHSSASQSLEEHFQCPPPVCEIAQQSVVREKKDSQLETRGGDDVSPPSVLGKCMGTTVHEISEVVRAENCYVSMEERLENLGATFDCEIVEKVLKRCFKVPRLAIQFFNWVKLRDGFSHSTSIFNTLCAIAGEMKDLELVEKLMEEMEKNSCEKDIKTWTILISIFGKSKIVGKALLIYDRMRKSGFDPDEHVYKTIIEALCNAGKPEIAMEFYKEMVRKEIVLPIRIYKLLIKSLAKSGDTTSVLNLAKDVITLSTNPDDVYHSVLKSFCISGRIREALELIRDLKMKGITFSSEYYETLVKGLCRSKRISDALQILKIMESKGVVNGRVYGIVINNYLQRNETSKALAMFKNTKESGHLIETSTYTKLMQNLFDRNEYNKGFEIYNEMRERGVELDSVAMMAVVSGHVRNNNISEGLRIFNNMKTEGIKLTVKFFSVLVMELCKVSKTDEVIMVLNEMKDAKIVIKDELFDWIISYMQRNGDRKGVEKVKHMQNIQKTLPQLIEKSKYDLPEPNSSSIEAAETGCRFEPPEKTSNEQDLVKIFRILSSSIDWNAAKEALEKCSVRFTPKLVVELLSGCNTHGNSALHFFNWVGKLNGYSHTAETYHMAIKLAGRGKDFKHMRSLFYEMRRNHCPINSDTWTIMIMQYGRIGLTKIALEVFKEMKASKCNPNSNTYKYLIISLCEKKGRIVDEAINLFQEMIRVGYVPDKELIDNYLDCLCKVGRLSDARKCMDSLHKIGYAIPLSYSFYIRALCRIGKLDEASALAEEVGSEKSTLDQYTYGSLIHGLLQQGNLKEALRRIESMKKAGTTPNVHVYTSLIVYFFKENQIKESLKILARMIQEGYEPTIVTYSALIRGFMSNGKISDGWTVFRRLKERGPLPDFKTYSIFITCLCKAGKSEDAFMILSEMFDAGIAPSTVNFRTVFFGLNREGKHEFARTVMHQKSVLRKSRRFLT